MESEKKLRKRHTDRITLSSDNLERLDEWINQITSQHKGVALNRKEIVNWLILSHPETLSSEEEQELCSHFYDEIRFLKATLSELKAAKARGERTSLHEILRSVQPSPRKPNKRKVREEKEENIPEKLNEFSLKNEGI